jgi:tripartite-type tricarboxylate transporter receptor subunit TctC
MLAGLAALAMVRTAVAQTRAAHPAIRLIVPVPAGGSADRVGRLVAEALHAILEVPVQVENVPGDGGVVGTNAIAAGPSDGSVLGLAISSAVIGGKLLSRAARFNPTEDFTWLAILGSYPNAMVVSAKSVHRQLDAWLAAARTASQPLVYASYASGSAGHLAGAYLRYEQGANLTHRPLESLNHGYALLSEGKIDVLFDGVPNATIEARRLGHPIVAVTSARRATALPDVPAFGERWKESFDVWIGLVAPRNLDKAAYFRLAPAVGVLLGEARYVDSLRAAGLVYMGLSGTGTMAFLESEFLRNAKLIGLLNDDGLRR